MLIAIDAVGIREGGGAAVLAELLHWLPRARPDWRWHVFLFEKRLRQFEDPEVPDNVSLEFTGQGDSGAARLIWANAVLPGRLRRLGVDLLFSLANLGSFWPKITQVVYCQQLLALVPESRAAYSLLQRCRLRLLGLFVRRAAKASAATIVQTAGMKEQFLRIQPRLAGKVHVIPNGCRTPTAPTVLRPEKKQRIDACPRPRLIYLSVLRHHKNHLTLLHAFAKIVQTQPEARLLLTVDEQTAPCPDTALLLVQVRTLARQLGLAERVVWLGQLTPDEVAYALSQSDLLLFPSLAESFGLPLAEAMAAGCPIAAADLPYAHEVAGPAAEFFNPHDAHAIAHCILSLLADPARLDRLRHAGAERRERFSYANVAGQIVQVLEQATRRSVG